MKFARCAGWDANTRGGFAIMPHASAPLSLTLCTDGTMSNIRFEDGREHRFTISKPTEADPVLIACPKCSSKAVVIPLGEDKVRASCVECGYTTDKIIKKQNCTIQGHR